MAHESEILRVAHYYPWVYLKSGIERVMLEICRRSKHRHTIFTNHYDHLGTYPGFRDLPVIQLRKVSVRRAIWPVLKAATIIAFQKIDLCSFDVLIVHSEGLGDFSQLRRCPIPAVCFCHTPLRPVFDKFYRQRALIRYKGLPSVAFRSFSAVFKVIDQFAWSRYRYIFFNSAETEARAKMGGLLEKLNGNYEILHPGIDWNDYQPTWKYEPYFLVAGRIMWTKNIELAIEAFFDFKQQYDNSSRFRLIIAGMVDTKSQSYLEKLRQMVVGRDDVDFILSPSDEELWKLYANCYCLLFPAFNEDWGMVPLEANAFGKPIIAVNQGGLVESQVDGRTGYLVAPEPRTFSQAMGRLFTRPELTAEMGRAARLHSQKYDWSHFVSRLDAVLEHVGRNDRQGAYS